MLSGWTVMFPGGTSTVRPRVALAGGRRVGSPAARPASLRAPSALGARSVAGTRSPASAASRSPVVLVAWRALGSWASSPETARPRRRAWPRPRTAGSPARVPHARAGRSGCAEPVVSRSAVRAVPVGALLVGALRARAQVGRTWTALARAALSLAGRSVVASRASALVVAARPPAGRAGVPPLRPALFAIARPPAGLVIAGPPTARTRAL